MFSGKMVERRGWVDLFLSNLLTMFRHFRKYTRDATRKSGKYSPYRAPGQRSSMSAYVRLHRERGGSFSERKEQKNDR